MTLVIQPITSYARVSAVYGHRAPVVSVTMEEVFYKK